MRGKRTASDVKANAVGLALVKGVPAASKATGVPQRTIRDWKQEPEFAELRLSAKDAVGEIMWVAIQVGLDEIHAGLKSPSEKLKDKADAVFGLIDKRALLMGEATTRSEVTHFRDYDDHERQALSELADRILEEDPETIARSVEEGTSSEVR